MNTRDSGVEFAGNLELLKIFTARGECRCSLSEEVKKQDFSGWVPSQQYRKRCHVQDRRSAPTEANCDCQKTLKNLNKYTHLVVVESGLPLLAFVITHNLKLANSHTT
jgi:hypothetical protein